MPNGSLDDRKRHALMDHEKRVVKGGQRPAPQMTSAPTVKWFSEAANQTIAPGVTTHTLLRTPEDPTVEIFRTDLGEGTKTAAQRSTADQRILVEGSGTIMLDGLRKMLSPADLLLLPRGTTVAFFADRPSGLVLWAVATPKGEAPMTSRAAVLAEDPRQEFFVGEGMHVLERANSPDDPAVSFDRCRVPQGITTAEHCLKTDERYLITRGEGTMELAGRAVRVQRGDVVLVPRGVSQRITAGLGGVDFYAVCTPRHLVEDYDRHLRDAVIDAQLYDGSAGTLAAVEAKIHAS